MKKVIFTVILMALLYINAPPAMAGMLNLTTAGSTGTLNGAWFYEANAASTGTGLIQSFVRIQAEGVEQGYNTDYRPVEYDELTSATFTHSLLLDAVPTVDISGTLYREFLLDTNENGPSNLISLDSIEIYQASTGILNDHAGTGFSTATLVYDLDTGADGDSWIKLDYSLNSGSGSGDMFAYIPDSLFVDLDYVYLYSQFGAEFGAVAGPEEWAVRLLETPPPPPPVPVPGAVLLGMLGLTVAGVKLRKFS